MRFDLWFNGINLNVTHIATNLAISVNVIINGIFIICYKRAIYHIKGYPFLSVFIEHVLLSMTDVTAKIVKVDADFVSGDLPAFFERRIKQ